MGDISYNMELVSWLNANGTCRGSSGDERLARRILKAKELKIEFDHTRHEIGIMPFKVTYMINPALWPEFVRKLNIALAEIKMLELFAFTSVVPIPELILPLTTMPTTIVFGTNFPARFIHQNVLNSITALNIGSFDCEDLLSDSFSSHTIEEVWGWPSTMSWDQYCRFVHKFHNVKFKKHNSLEGIVNFDVNKPDNIAELQEEYGTDDWNLIRQRCYEQQPMIKSAAKLT